ncbi:MAG: sugar ABC transporter permease [Bacillales bacterium]|nr:sugar ABC transporter permease [Bacillales bacterium]MDY5919570.1 sugar ABC transporter permease [Candidatus Enteromonas sp.]
MAAENTPVNESKKTNPIKDFFGNLFKPKERVSADAGEKNNWKAWLYLAPTIILLSVFTFYPLVNTIFIAFLKNYDYVTQSHEGFTFDNFGVVLGLLGKGVGGAMIPRWQCIGFESEGALGYYLDAAGQQQNAYFTMDVIRYAFPNTLIITFITVPVSIIIALLISIGLNSIPAFQKMFQTIFFIPYVTNAIAVGMVFAVLFDYKGIINYLFQLGNLTWIDQGAPTWRAMIALCVYIVWHSLPYKILIFLSGLQNIDKQYYDAAKIDSAGGFKTMMNVTVPLLSPQILYIMITSFIGAFKEYTSVVGLFGKSSTDGGGTNNLYTVVYYIYDQVKGNVQYGAAAAVLLFIVILIFTAIQFKVSKKRVHY